MASVLRLGSAAKRLEQLFSLTTAGGGPAVSLAAAVPSCCLATRPQPTVRFISQNAVRKWNGKKAKEGEGNGTDSRLAIPYHNGNSDSSSSSSSSSSDSSISSSSISTVQAVPMGGIKTVTKTLDNPNKGIVFDLQFDTPPVLFIRKYKEVIDTQDLLWQDDDLSPVEKCSAITPETLTQKKIKFIQDAVRKSSTFEKLSEKFKPRPDPILSAKVSSGEVKRSVFTDSDFETIRPEKEEKKVTSARDFELEWVTAKVNLASLPQYYLTLSKARLTLLVCMTAAAGYGMAPGPASLYVATCATVGTAMASSAANSINQILEVPFDSQMSRTKNRVLVRGGLSPAHAFSFAVVMAGAGTLLLYTQVNGLAACLSAGNLLLYTCVYTPLKRVSIVNTWVGSVVGAIPPLIGWAACTGGLEPGAFVLAGILYAWQFPHFNSLSWNLRPDYSRAGYRMMSVTHPELCRRVALRYSAACIAICTAAPLLGVTDWAFALDSLVLNVYFTYLAYGFYKKADSSSSRKLFRFSLIHLPLLMTLMWISKKSWPSSAEAESAAAAGSTPTLLTAS